MTATPPDTPPASTGHKAEPLCEKLPIPTPQQVPTLGPDGENSAQSCVEILEQKQIYNNFVSLTEVKLRIRKFNSTWTPPYSRHIFAHGASGIAATALPYDPVSDKIILIEQFRLPSHLRQRHSSWSLELAAGLIEHGEDIEEAVRREIEEEAGHKAKRLISIGTSIPSPGIFTEVLHNFIAEIDAREHSSVHGVDSEEENTRTHTLTAQDTIALADSGYIEDGKTLFAINWFARHHQQIREKWLA